MSDPNPSTERLLDALRERAKELNCLYDVEEILRHDELDAAGICRRLVKTIPAGWQFPDLCRARVVLDKQTYQDREFDDTPWKLEAPILINGRPAGALQIFYMQSAPGTEHAPFLPEESRLLQVIAERLGQHLGHREARRTATGADTAPTASAQTQPEWHVVLELLRQTDRDLHLRVCRRMLTRLALAGIPEADELRRRLQAGTEATAEDDPNRPQRAVPSPHRLSEMSDELFAIAASYQPEEELLADLRRWIQEDKLSVLSMIISRQVPLPAVADAIRRYQLLASPAPSESSTTKRGVEVALIRRFLSEQLEYINCAKRYMELADFHDLLSRLVFSTDSHGRLGGKSAGLYLAAGILKRSPDPTGLLAGIRIPKTWHLTSDLILHFMHYNDLDDLVEQKYKDLDQIRQEYPHVVQLFRQSPFPPDVLKGLSMALDDFGDKPLIVRSSSLLEDRMGAAFAGKYKSLFLANQGTKQERMKALTDAIAEVYASTFGPDPIEYRIERGLIDFSEEMGIILQEVVGTKIGPYFLPAYAGVAFSRNEFRWSPRIRREDGLVRIVPGLGTRAVDRLSDDYPILIAPGQPRIRANVSVDEALRYSPKHIDLINLQSNSFETVPLAPLFRRYADDIPAFDQIVSIVDPAGMLRPPGFHVDISQGDFAVTFLGLSERSDFVRRIGATLRTLEEVIGTPIDIEFASDGKDLYILQCRAQSSPAEFTAAEIPKDIAPGRVIFSARRHVPNGQINGITHIVYVDPQQYQRLSDRSDLLAVGRVVGMLNERLPRRKFILIGPGRWGSRGDIRLGVSVTYSDINNTAALIEIARRTGDYVPEVSYGTHFFQDLVEAGIHYLPLYPDEPDNDWKEEFFTGSQNFLTKVLPDYERLAGTVRLIDVRRASGGHTLDLLMNADLGEGVAILAET